MFTIIKTYKSVFLGLIRSEFGRPLEGGYTNQDVIVDDNGSELDEHVQELIKDGKIDEKDLETLESIKGDMSKLEVQTQADLKEYLKNMTLSVLQNGFKIKGQEGVDALTRIAELTGDTELLSRIKGIDFKLIDGKSIVKEENTFIVYDKEGDREGFLYNDRIDTNRRPWDNNNIYNDNKINIKTSKVDGDINSILSSNDTYKKSNDKSKKVNTEKAKVQKEISDTFKEKNVLLKTNITTLNNKGLNELLVKLNDSKNTFNTNTHIHPGHKKIFVPKIEAKIGEVNAEKEVIRQILEEKKNVGVKVYNTLTLKTEFNSSLMTELKDVNQKLKGKGEEILKVSKLSENIKVNYINNIKNSKDINELTKIETDSSNFLKVLLKMGVPKSDIDGYSKDIFTVLVAKKGEFKKAEAIIKQVKQAKLEKQQIKSTIEWNKNKYTEEQIKVIQTALGIEADGKFGPQTLNAVKSFQENNNLSIDGKIGSGTLGVLGITFSNKTHVKDLKNKDSQDLKNKDSQDLKKDLLGETKLKEVKVLEDGETKNYGTFNGKNGESNDIFVKREDDTINVLLKGKSTNFDIDYNIEDGKITKKIIEQKIQTTIDGYFEGNNEYGLKTKLHLNDKQVSDLDNVGIDYEKVVEKNGVKYYQLDRSGLWSNDFLVSIDNNAKVFNIIDKDGKLGEGINVTKTEELKETLIKSDKLLDLMSKIESRIKNASSINELKGNELNSFKITLDQNGNILVNNSNVIDFIVDNNNKILPLNLDNMINNLEYSLLSEKEQKGYDNISILGNINDINKFANNINSSFQVKSETEFRIDRPGTNDINIEMKDGQYSITDDNNKIDLSVSSINIEGLKKVDTILKAFDDLSSRELKEGYKETNFDNFLNSLPKITDTNQLLKISIVIENNGEGVNLRKIIKQNNEVKEKNKFNNELKERDLEGLDLSMQDINELKELEGVHVDLSNIKVLKTISNYNNETHESTRIGGKYEVNIDGGNNLVIEQKNNNFIITDTDKTFTLNVDNSTLKDAIIVGTKKVNEEEED